jgi:saccharopine dehydrogenase (NAD+, L-lysine-forming)
MEGCGTQPKAMIIGAAGRCGRGASELLSALGVEVTPWDIEETRRGGPFEEILDHDIFINCVFVSEPIPPFLTHETLARPHRLSVICDVSCDPLSEVNPLPIYQQTTTFDDPVVRVSDGDPAVDLIAIDHLPSMLPAESSASFSEQLSPFLLTLDEPDAGVWGAAKAKFDAMAALARDPSSPT